MRPISAAVLLLALVAPLRAAPADAEEAALAARVAELLEADTLRERAWGAHLAGKHGVAAAAPRLIEMLSGDSGASGYEEQALRTALLDAALRLGLEPDLEVLAPYVDRSPALAVILLSRRGPEAAALLRPLMGRDGIGRGTARAVLQLLAGWRDPHVAAHLLEGFAVRARVDVYPPMSGGGGGAFPRVPHYHHLIVRLEGSWPPFLHYEVSDVAGPGSTLLAPGPAPLYYRRIEVERGTANGVPGVWPGTPEMRFRLNCLMQLVHADPADYPLLFEPRRHVTWESGERYLAEVRTWLGRIRGQHRQLVSLLTTSRLLTEEEAAGLSLTLDLEVEDHRPEEGRTPLPAVE